MLSAVMILSLLSSCSADVNIDIEEDTNIDAEDADPEIDEEEMVEMDRNFEAADTSIIIETNDAGVYTVTITEDDLIYDEDLAGNVLDIVIAEEAGVFDEMMRGDTDLENGEDASSGEVFPVDNGFSAGRIDHEA